MITNVLDLDLYINVLDLYLFPPVLHCHSALLQLSLYNNTEVNKEQTWNLEDNWDCLGKILRLLKLPVHLFSRTVSWDLSSRRMATTHGWPMAHGTPHCDVHQDYENTTTGIKLKHPLEDVEYDL